ncbi:MAG: GNAT family N-acetyltransferase [Anaerolineae bacterium]|nr:GNAT family N-acetyltransferase [Anaerolineae bacterium]
MTIELGSLFVGTLVRLAASTPDDVIAWTHWFSDGEFLRQMDTDYARLRSQREYERMLENSDGPNSVTFRIRAIEGDKLIGFIALHSIEWNNGTTLLSMGIGEADYRAKGYGTEALRLTLRYAFTELNLYRVGLNVISNNGRAIRAYEKAGFVREGVTRGQVHRDGQRYDLIWMGILREEWENTLR